MNLRIFAFDGNRRAFDSMMMLSESIGFEAAQRVWTEGRRLRAVVDELEKKERDHGHSM